MQGSPRKISIIISFPLPAPFSSSKYIYTYPKLSHSTFIVSGPSRPSRTMSVSRHLEMAPQLWFLLPLSRCTRMITAAAKCFRKLIHIHTHIASHRCTNFIRRDRFSLFSRDSFSSFVSRRVPFNGLINITEIIDLPSIFRIRKRS